MRTRHGLPVLVLSLVFAGGLAAQISIIPVPPPQVGPALFNNPGSQTNGANHALQITGSVITTGPNGVSLMGPFSVLGPASESVTMPWIYQPTSSSTHTLDMAVGIHGLPGTQLTLGVTVTPGPGPAGTPGPWLPGIISFPNLGGYHLDGLPTPVFDSLGLLGGLSVLPLTDASGVFSFNAAVPLDGPNQVTIQAVTVDPSSPIGMHLTAAFAIYSHL